MTISSSLNAGIAGLQTNATQLATISDNIANSSTIGYKRVVTDFHSMVISSNGSTYSAGGVRATTQRLIDENGALIATSNSTDLAVRGRGFLPVAQEADVLNGNSNPQMLLTTTGTFRTDDEGYLRSPSGLILLGWPANADGTVPLFPRDTSDGLEPVQINVNQFSSEPTTRINLGVNLPATETLPGADGTTYPLPIEYFDNLGISQNLNVSFTPTVPAPGDPASNEWTIVIEDSVNPGTTIGEYVVTFTDNQTAGGTLASVTTTSGGAYDPVTGSVIVNVAGGPIEIDIGTIGAGDGMTQLSDDFAPVAITKDGSSVGNMISVEVDPNGFVRANFDTGITRTVYQIPLVDLPNPNGLVSLDRQTYLPSTGSGSFYLWNASEGPTGDIVGFALEESNTDVAGELTTMIRTQRAYSSNAKVIQTVDEMLQETTNIKR
ncbi:MAG: flagellar hook-basal body complex protein [Pseudomonadota bacterium]